MARRISLREFQQDLVRRLNEAAAADAPSARLGVQVGTELWLVKLEEAGCSWRNATTWPPRCS